MSARTQSLRPSPASRRRAGAALTALVLAATGLLAVDAPRAAAASEVDGAHSAGDALFPSIGNGGYNARHYAVDLSYLGPDEIRATSTMTAQTDQRLRSYSLDLEGLSVSAVRVDGADARFSRHGDKLVITPTHPVTGTFATTVSYAGHPVTHVDPDGSKDGWVHTSDSATVLSEPLGAMTWFPNNNTPRDKATFTVAVTAPKALSVAGNGDLTAKTSHGSTTTWTWREDRKMATYLAMVSIGRYDVYHSTMTSTAGRRLPVWTFVDPRLGSLATQRRQLPVLVRYLERQFGAYPFSSVGFVARRTGAGYSLETQGRPVFNGAPQESTMVHELSHQWFGDAVTPKDWGDIWLNEGFATYATWLWKAAEGGTSVAARLRSTYDAHSASSSFWRPAPAALPGAKDLFGSPVYARGGLTLAALRHREGATVTARILRRWYADHDGYSVRTSSFVALAGREAQEGLHPFFRSWLYSAHKPARY